MPWAVGFFDREDQERKQSIELIWDADNPGTVWLDPHKIEYRPKNKWNDMVVIVREGKVTVTLNGQKLFTDNLFEIAARPNVARDLKRKHGRMGIYSGTGWVCF